MNASRGQSIQVPHVGVASVRGDYLTGYTGGHMQAGISLRPFTKQLAPRNLLATHYSGFVINSFEKNRGWIGPRKSAPPSVLHDGHSGRAGPSAALFAVSRGSKEGGGTGLSYYSWATFAHSARGQKEESEGIWVDIHHPIKMAILCTGLQPGTHYRVYWSEQAYAYGDWQAAFEPVRYAEFRATKGWHCLFGKVDGEIYKSDGTIGKVGTYVDNVWQPGYEDATMIHPQREIGGDGGDQLKPMRWIALGFVSYPSDKTPFPAIEATYHACMTASYANRAVKGERVAN